jgi:hypothetical protein
MVGPPLFVFEQNLDQGVFGDNRSRMWGKWGGKPHSAVCRAVGGLQASGIKNRKKRKDLCNRQRRENERNEKTKQTK